MSRESSPATRPAASQRPPVQFGIRSIRRAAHDRKKLVVEIVLPIDVPTIRSIRELLNFARNAIGEVF